MSERWITVVGWEDFQHYRNRRPLWIKNYTALLAKPAYRKLLAKERALLHGLWLLYAASEGQVPFSVRLVNDWLALRSNAANYESLRKAGFIRISASKPLAQRQRERKKSSKTTRTTNAEPELLAFPEWLEAVQANAKVVRR
jgi:hypothetical protein